MTASKSYDRPGKVRTIRAHMRAHPGVAYTPSQLGTLLGLSTHAAAEALLYLANRGEVIRQRSTKQRSGPGATKYKGLAVIAMADDDAEEASA